MDLFETSSIRHFDVRRRAFGVEQPVSCEINFLNSCRPEQAGRADC